MSNELNHDKIQAEIAKLLAETSKLNKETRWYEVVVIAGILVAITAAAKWIL